MALRFSSNSKAYHYGGRVTPLVILSCMVAATGGILFGYDLGISGGVTSMEPFLEKFFPKVQAKMREDSRTSNYCKFDSQLLTAFTSSLYIGGLFASLCASWVTRGFGRRTSMLLGGASFLVGAAIGGLALNISMLIIGRVLLGIGIGFTNQEEISKSSNHGREKKKITSLILLVQPTSALFNLYMDDRGPLSRPALLIIGGVQMFVSQLIVGGMIVMQLGDHGRVSKGYAYIALVPISVYVAGFGWSWGPLGWLVPSEIFPLEKWSTRQSIMVAVSFVFAFIVVHTFLAMLGLLKFGIFFFFGGWHVLVTMFIYLLLATIYQECTYRSNGWSVEGAFWKKIVGNE